MVARKSEVWKGTLNLMVLKVLENTDRMHGYGIARRIEETSEDLLTINYGTLYPALVKLQQQGYIASQWGFSENNRKAKFYRITDSGKKFLARQTREWEQTTELLARFLTPEGSA